MATLRETNGLRQSCDGCHVRKLRCSRNTTACVRCIRNGVECVYSPARKVGRRSKAEKSALRDLGVFSNTKATQLLESLCGVGAEEASQTSEHESSQATFWAELSSAEYTQLPLEDLWAVSQPVRGESSVGHRAQYGNNNMAGSSEAFLEDDISTDQSQIMHTMYDEPPNIFGTRRVSDGVIEAREFINFSGDGSDSSDEAPTDVILNKIQRLSELQQDLFTQRARLPDPAVDICFAKVGDIEATIGTGRTILELTRSLFTSFTTAEPNTEQCNISGKDSSSDPATMLLALTPSLLVVTTYNDILSLISAALDEMRNVGSCEPAGVPEIGIIVGIPRKETVQRPQGQPRKHSASGLYEMTLKVGKLDLDFPMRLIVLMTVIEYQLGPLQRSLQLIRKRTLQTQGLGVSGDMLTMSIDGLWTALGGLLDRIGKLVQQAKTLDIC